jgi:hypothetical protein
MRHSGEQATSSQQHRQGEPQAEVAEHVVAEPVFRPATILAVVPPPRYAIADALADVANAIGPKAAALAKATVAPNAAIAPSPTNAVNAANAAKATIAKASTVTKARVAPTVAIKPLAPVAPKVVRPATEARNDWQPIATAPLDRNVQVGVTSKSGILAIFFPCRRTESGWINAVVKAPLLHEPACWREWREDYFEAN